MATDIGCRSSHLLGLSKSIGHQKNDWHEVAAPIRHAITLLCETLHEQMAGMQRVESELARLRIHLGSAEHSQAALEATVQGQLDACVHHVEKRLFKAAQTKVPRSELEECIQQVRERVESVVSEGLAATVAPLQQQLKTDSQHTAQLCVRLDALDAQQKKLVMRVAKHQKHIGASEIAIEDLRSRMAGAEDAALRTSDAVSAAQACSLQVGRQWEAAQQEHTEFRQRLDSLATSTEDQLQEVVSSANARIEAVDARVAVLDNGEEKLAEKLRALAAGQDRLERDVRKGHERVEGGAKGLADLGFRVADLERAQKDAEGAGGARLDEVHASLRVLESKVVRDTDKQASRLTVLEASATATPRMIEEASEAAVAGLVAQVSNLGRTAEEALSRAGRADDKAREVAGVASQNQTAIKGLAASMTQLTRQAEGAEQKAKEATERLKGIEQKQHKLTLSVHTAVAEQMAHVPTTAHVERLVAAQAEQLTAEWHSSREQSQQEGAQRDAHLRQLQAHHDSLQKTAEQLKAGIADAVTSAALEAALAGLAAPLNKGLQEDRAALGQTTRRLSDVEGRLQQLRKEEEQLKTGVDSAVTPAVLDAALAKATATMTKGLEEERAAAAGLMQRLTSLEGQLETVRKDTVQTLETRVSAAQTVTERQAAQLVDAQVAALRQQLEESTKELSDEVSALRGSLQEQIDHRCDELSTNCRTRAQEAATHLADQAKQMEPALLKLTQQMEGIQRLCRQELQSVRSALESKASAEQMLELKAVFSEVDKLKSQLNSGTSTPRSRRSVVGGSLRPTNWKT